MDHEKVISLAERLEFCNALLKQERIEHGKSKAYIAELEDKVTKLEKKVARDLSKIKDDEVIKARAEKNAALREVERWRDRALAAENAKK